MRGSLAWVLAGSLLVGGCARTPDEQQIREALAAMADAVEEKAPRRFVAYLAEDFQDQEGRDVDGVRALMRLHFLSNRKLGVFVTRTVVEVSGDRATAQLDVTLTGTSRWLPERVRALDLRVEWRRRQGQWKAVAASWKPLFGQ